MCVCVCVCVCGGGGDGGGCVCVCVCVRELIVLNMNTQWFHVVFGFIFRLC